MHVWHRFRTLACLVAWLLPLAWPLAVRADLLSHIEVHRENNVGVIHIVLTRPVIYTHHFPADHGYLIHIFFNDLTLDRSNLGAPGRAPGRPDDEFMRSPPNDIVPVFWVAYNNYGTNDLSLDPFHLLVQFGQPVHYKILPDADNRGFYIFVLDTDAPPATTPPADKANNPADSTDQPAPDRQEPK